MGDEQKEVSNTKGNYVSEGLAMWNSKLPVMGVQESFFYRSLRWYFVTFLLFAVIVYGGTSYLMTTVLEAHTTIERTK